MIKLAAAADEAPKMVGESTNDHADHRCVTLQALRGSLDALDGDLVALIGKRVAASVAIARIKDATGRATRDRTREGEVLSAARRRAATVGVPPHVADEVMNVLIRMSLAVQEQTRLAVRGSGRGKKALVIGGNSAMGAWFVRFMTAHGFEVEISEVESAVPLREAVRDVKQIDWRRSSLSHSYIVVATPGDTTQPTLHELALRQPLGVVFDVASSKGSLASGFAALRNAGVRVTSIHPMFGPDTELLSDKIVVLLDLGCSSALNATRKLFEETMARQMVMSLDEYTRSVTQVVTLLRAANVVLVTALTEAPASDRWTALSSPVFEAQWNVVKALAQEDPWSREESGLQSSAFELLSSGLRMLREADGAESPGVVASLTDYFRAFVNSQLMVSS